MHVRPGLGGGDPATGAVSGSHPGVDRHARLEGDERPLPPGRRQPDAVDILGSGIDFACSDHLEPGRPQGLAAAGRRRPRVINGDNDFPDAGGDQGCGTRPGPAGVIARLEGDDCGRAACAAPGFGQGNDLRVRATGPPVKALPHHITRCGEQDTTHYRIGQHRPVALRSEFDSTAQGPCLGGRQRGGGHVLQCARAAPPR